MLERLIFTIIISYLLIIQLFNARLIEPMIQSLGRTRVYEQTIKSAWGLSLLLLALLFLFQVPLNSVGINILPPAGESQAWNVFFLSCVLIALLTVLYLLVKTSAKVQERLRPYYELDMEKLLLPRTQEEQKAWTGVSVTAGVTEEFIFRGVLLYTLSLYMDVSNTTLALVGGILFGIAHAYQGVRGVITTGVVGYGLSALYLGMGVLWPVMIIHALLDLIAGPIHVASKNE